METKLSFKKQWYKNAIIYGVDIRNFYDSNNDGVGDFKGATEKLDYLKDLGINCIWLLPIHPSSGQDNGYDVTDFYNIDKDLGTLDDFRDFLDKANKLDIKVIMDLVVHHTSYKHPWFLDSKKEDSKYRNYYVWRKHPPLETSSPSAFAGPESNVWRYDRDADAYYFHKFYHSEPDLNLANREVQEEIFNIVKFWLQFPVYGFRIDAATLLFDSKDVEGTEVENPGEFLEELNNVVMKCNSEAVLVGEADIAIEKIPTYFKNGDRIEVLYNFILNNKWFYSLAIHSIEPIKEGLRDLLRIPDAGWVNFIRTLDELSLVRITKRQQKRVFKAFAPNKNMILYNRGIRRRFGSLFEGNKIMMRSVLSQLFSFPNAVMIGYGDEIGMGDDLGLKERNSVRTLMQWSDKKNAGFSNAEKNKLITKAVESEKFHYEKINVENELKDPESILNFTKKIIELRKSLPEIGVGECEIIDSHNEHLLILKYTGEDRAVLVINNIFNQEYTFNLDISSDEIKEIFADSEYESVENFNRIKINPYGFRWFTLK